MRTVLLRVGAVAVGVTTAIGYFRLSSRAAPDAPKAEPVAEIKDVMHANNNKPNGLFGLIKAVLATEPSAADWKLAAHRATMIAEGGNTLMGLTPPKGGDDAAGKAKWATHCAEFRAAARDLAKQLKMKKLDDAKKSMVELEKQCAACHGDHAPE